MRKVRFLLCAVIGLVTFAVFAAAIRFGLCHVDDTSYLTDVIQRGITLDGLRFALTEVSESIWMPLTYVSYMVDYSLGWGTRGLHLQSILWQAANAVLCFLFLERLCRNRSAAFVAALVWAIHPLRVESVVWIASRKDVISTFFFLAALLAWLKGGVKGIAAAFALVAVGGLAKSSVMVFPVFALAIDWFVTGERKDRNVYWAFAALSGVLALEASWGQGVAATGYMAHVPLLYRIVNAFAATTVYLGNFVWPQHLGIQVALRYPDPPVFSWIGAGMLAAIAAWFATVLARRFKLGRTEGCAFAGVAAFLVSLGPFVGIAGFGYHAFADRFTILPSLGLSLVLACVWRRWMLPVAVAALLALGWRTVDQVGYWKDNVTLLTHTLRIDREDSFTVQRMLGVVYWKERHDLPKTYEHLMKAYACPPCEWMREMCAENFPLLMDAAFALGKEKEIEDLYYWFRKRMFAMAGNRMSEELAFAEALWSLTTKAPVEERRKEVESALEGMKRRAPEHYMTKLLEYDYLRWLGDRPRMKALLERLAKDEHCPFYRQWASKELKDHE